MLETISSFSSTQERPNEAPVCFFFKYTQELFLKNFKAERTNGAHQANKGFFNT